jgi:hypothetical protein
MRSILDKDSEKKKQKQGIVILGIILVLLMVFSTLGYAFYGSLQNQRGGGESVEHNGIEFENQGNGWKFDIDGYEFLTRFNPLEVSNISVVISSSLNEISSDKLYFSSSSLIDLPQSGVSEIAFNLQDFLLRTNLACLDESCEENYPIKNCTDSNIVIFEEDSGFTRIRQEEKCIYVHYAEGEELRATDALIFKLLEII